MPQRYLEADKVTLPARAPQFVKPGYCQWCNKLLTGRAKLYCPMTKEEKHYYTASPCSIRFLNWWCSRPAYIRATFIKNNFTCQECGLHPMREDKPWLPDISQLEADHIIPLSRGGRTEMSNLQTLCRDCNRKKGTKVPEDKVEEAKKLQKVLPSLPFKMPKGIPLCGKEWLYGHLHDYTPEEIGSLSIEIGYGSKWLPPVALADKKTRVKTIIRGLRDA